MNTTEQAALSVAEQMLPVLLQAIAAGAVTTSPEAAVIAMVSEIVPPLINSFGANSAQIQQLMQALVKEINAGQKVIDKDAEARGIPAPSETASQS